jgi:hypothetical protein
MRLALSAILLVVACSVTLFPKTLSAAIDRLQGLARHLEQSQTQHERAAQMHG